MRLCFNVLSILLILLQCGCSRIYFRPADQIPTPRQIPLSLLPVKTYWMGIVFNGAKIGFSRFELSLGEENNRFEIRSEAYFRIRFLMMDKTIRLAAVDQVTADLGLVRFAYEFDLDGHQMSLTGGLNDKALEVTTVVGQEETTRRLGLEDRKIYPSSAIGLYPVLQGLAVGRRYSYWVYDGQTRRLARVEQRVVGYEESELYRGAAYRIETRFLNQGITTWMDPRGYPLLEMSLGGVIVAYREDQAEAQRYLTQSALNKDDVFLDYSLIRTDRPLAEPAHLRQLAVQIYGMPADRMPPSDHRQDCTRQHDRVTCRIDIDTPRTPQVPEEFPSQVRRYVLPTTAISAHNPEIRRLSQEITATARNDLESARLLIDWMQAHIRREAVDVFTAMDVLEGGAAECQGHALLYAAFERSLDVPCRVVNGLVYSGQYRGFLYHSWNETYLEGRWIAVDPTFGQIPADATHIKLIDGSETADLLPLVDLIGKLRIHLLEFE